jgi:hypothetical protein
MGELYPGHEKDLAALRERSDAHVAAATAVLPGPLAGAFDDTGPGPIAGLRVRRLVHYDFVLLKKLDSPLLRQLSAAPGGKTEFDDESGYEMILQFTRPVLEVRALVERGRKAFRQLALEEIGLRLGPLEVAMLLKAVEAEFVRAFSTVVKYSSPESPESSGTVFTPPPALPTTTGSAGGSITSGR